MLKLTFFRSAGKRKIVYQKSSKDLYSRFQQLQTEAIRRIYSQTSWWRFFSRKFKDGEKSQQKFFIFLSERWIFLVLFLIEFF
jgi:hypothetical protein